MCCFFWLMWTCSVPDVRLFEEELLLVALLWSSFGTAWCCCSMTKSFAEWDRLCEREILLECEGRLQWDCLWEWERTLEWECLLIWECAVDETELAPLPRRLVVLFDFLSCLFSGFGDFPEVCPGLDGLLTFVTPRDVSLDGLSTCLVISFKKAENFVFSFIKFVWASFFFFSTSCSFKAPTPEWSVCLDRTSIDLVFLMFAAITCPLIRLCSFWTPFSHCWWECFAFLAEPPLFSFPAKLLSMAVDFWKWPSASNNGILSASSSSSSKAFLSLGISIHDCVCCGRWIRCLDWESAGTFSRLVSDDPEEDEPEEEEKLELEEYDLEDEEELEDDDKVSVLDELNETEDEELAEDPEEFKELTEVLEWHFFNSVCLLAWRLSWWCAEEWRWLLLESWWLWCSWMWWRTLLLSEAL